MPKFSVRLYHTYCNEYVVEAETHDEAIEIADAYDDLKNIDTPECRAALAHPSYAGVEVVEWRAYEDTETRISALDAEGNWCDAE